MLSKFAAVGQMCWDLVGVIGHVESENVFLVIGDPISQLLSAWIKKYLKDSFFDNICPEHLSIKDQ